MRYDVVFEYNADDQGMSDVFHYADRDAAQDKFDELRQSLADVARAMADCKVSDEPDLYGFTSVAEQAYGVVMIVARE